MSRRSALALALVAVFASATLGACGSSRLVHRPTNPVVDQAITDLWLTELQRTARDGDWLLSRSYSGQGDFVVLFTAGEELSHAAMIDVTHGTVIESIASGVREIPLRDFVDRNRHLIVVRPHAPVRGPHSVDRARAQVGAGFDIGGMAGLGSADRFYCTELVYWASGLHQQDPHRELVITPGDLLEYGEVVYWSGRRDDTQLQRIAAGWQADRAPRVATRP